MLIDTITVTQKEFYDNTNQGIKGLDLEVAGNVTNVLKDIATVHNFEITGKYHSQEWP